ncbi:hypothetical protein BaRGS_00015525, partial [Batillaria attramentaria]
RSLLASVDSESVVVRHQHSLQTSPSWKDLLVELQFHVLRAFLRRLLLLRGADSDYELSIMEGEER